MRGSVVAIDVIRAFTTAAYAFGAGAAEILMVETVDAALELTRDGRADLAMGEDHGLRPDGFALPNSPVAAAQSDLDGAVIAQRTSAGTRGAVAAVDADDLWCASLVCASATAAALGPAAVGPTYVITGRFPDRPDGGEDDLACAELIEALRTGAPVEPTTFATRVATSEEAARTLALGDGHVHPDDIAYATHIDRFDFAMRASRDGAGASGSRRCAERPTSTRLPHPVAHHPPRVMTNVVPGADSRADRWREHMSTSTGSPTITDDIVVMDDETAAELGRWWWLPLATGIAWIIIGFAILQFNVTTVRTVAVLAGFVLLAAGVNEIAEMFVAPGWKWLHAILGAVFVAGGIVALVWPSPTFLAIANLFAWYLLFRGISDTITSIVFRDSIPLWGLMLASGIAQLALALWAVGYTGRSIGIMVIWVGLGALMKGIGQIFGAFDLRRLRA